MRRLQEQRQAEEDLQRRRAEESTKAMGELRRQQERQMQELRDRMQVLQLLLPPLCC